MDGRPYLTDNSLNLLTQRYLRKNDKKNIIETPRQMFERVAKCVAYSEKIYGSKKQYKQWYDRILDHLLNLNLMPASPYLFNSRDPECEEVGGLFSCYVLPIGDSIEEIYQCMAESAKIYQQAGGVGIDFSPIREDGAIVVTNKGKATGPLSFLRVFNKSAFAVEQGGVRRAASIAFLDIDHPDIEQFITIKSQHLPEINRLMKIVVNSTDQTLKQFAKMELNKLQQLTQFNLSIKITDAFMQAVKQNKNWDLISRQSGKVVKTIKAKKLFHMICDYAWKSGDPGIVYIDTVNKANKLPQLGPISSANPCSEVFLHPYHACNLVAVNLTKCLKDECIDYGKLEDIVRTAVRMAENAIDVSSYPLLQIEKAVKSTRGIGIGIMGFADVLISLGLQYDTQEAKDLLSEICKCIKLYAIEESKALAIERGVPDNWYGSVWEQNKTLVRNLWHTTLQPTGSVAIISGASHSIEPLWNVYYRRATSEGDILIELNKQFRQCVEERGIDIDIVIEELQKYGSIQKIDILPDDIKQLFKSASDISPENHILMQATAQKHVDQGISKTINCSSTATVNDIMDAYMLAYETGCKGITIFRDGSKEGVLSLISSEDKYHEELRDFLHTKYSVENLTAKEIGDILGVSEQCVFAKLKRYGIRKVEQQTAICASNRQLGAALKEIILANVLVGHSKINTVGSQSSFRLVSDHLVYAHNIRAQFLDRGVDCSDIMSVVTSKTYYYFDTHFLVDIYNLPVDYDSVVSIGSKRELKNLITNHFVRHLFLVGGVQTGKGGVKFTSNSRNGAILKQLMELLAKQIDIEIRYYDDGNIYISKASTDTFYNYVENNADISTYSVDFLCPECGEKLEMIEGCKHCPGCSWGACSV